jgi:hypothetical protein
MSLNLLATLESYICVDPISAFYVHFPPPTPKKRQIYQQQNKVESKQILYDTVKKKIEIKLESEK